VLIEDGPPQALKDLTEVRITVIVQSDERVTYEAPKQDTAASSQTITKRASDETCRWVKRHSSSGYSSGETKLVRDDSEAGGPMEKAAAQFRARTEPMWSGVSFTIPWVDVTYRVGDRLSGITGRGMDFPLVGEDKSCLPMAGWVVYDFRAQETRLGLRRAKG